ncbi:thioredoxin [Candidatus Endoriftia persephone str. Guaymas]|jgi:thioredoxin-related protein|uniref:Thioredoxin SoxW n=3 Tax=Gammaproteobacteria TaxID=1236 RepID=G2FG32_9GAMM|nr:thioredoxin fold domain-containing protein [Candidatus Endoriftia persephone]EGW54265.1 thioredoxin SoxW [endosymbiont of Tevnia jerichonana (vent Tica)]MBA1332771.1 thioredoxin [Candidatus Endoriftia persephone str. Guaymas]USF87436.1 thioredoxin fold domain-containing protein [Candidatus Endoriftia persephone]
MKHHRSLLPLLLWGSLLLSALPALAAEDTKDLFAFDDFPLEEPLSHPDWFKHSFLDLQEDLADVQQSGKQGLILYFGQQRCAYCKMLLQVNFGLSDITAYTRRHFEVVAINIWGIDEVTDLAGELLTERELAQRENTTFTPSLIFYDEEGHEALRLRGYYPPYQFRAALEYVADRHYQRESFPDYLARADEATHFEPGELNEESFFLPPPHNLDRSRFPGERPLAVFFEQGECHACDVLHGQPLREPAINRLFQRFDNVQLDINADTPIVIPDGRRSTAKQWAKELGLFYTPSLLFFDEQGNEIIRVDSVVRFYRLRNVANYINSRGYLSEPDYQRWRVSNAP